MRAAGAHHRRTAGQVLAQRLGRRQRSAHGPAHAILGKFAQEAGAILAAGDGDAGRAHGRFDEGIEFLDDVEAVHLGGEGADALDGQRVDHADLEDAGVGEGLAHVLVGRAGGDEADLRVAQLLAVEVAGLGVLAQFLDVLFHHHVALDGHGGHGDVLLRVLDVGAQRRLHALRGLNKALRMGDARHGAQHHRGIVDFGKFKGALGERQTLGGVRRLEHRQLGGLGVVAGILFVLGGVDGGIVRHADHQTGVDAHIGGGEQRVGGHVEAHVLHGGEAARPGQRRAHGAFQRHLLVGGPLGVDLVVPGGELGDLGRGRAGVGGNVAATGLVQPARHRRVPDHQFFHKRPLLTLV